MDYQMKWHKDLLVKDVFLSPPMSSSSPPSPTVTTTTTPSVSYHHRLQQQQQLKKMEVAPSDLLLDDTDVFGLNDTTSLLLEDGSGYQQHHPQVRITSVYADDLPTTPHSLLDSPDYLGLKRRHSSICSDISSDDGSSIQSDSDKRPCLMHSPCSSSASSPQLPMFDFDDDEEDQDIYEDEDQDNMDERHGMIKYSLWLCFFFFRTIPTTDFQPYPTFMESMTDDEDDTTFHHQHQPIKFELNTNDLGTKSSSHPKPTKKTKKSSTTTTTTKKQPKEKPAKSSSQNNNKKSSSDNMTDDGAPLPIYVPHGAPEVDLRYSTQGLYKHLLKHRVDWCRYCGTTEGVNWRPGPWGKRTLCNKHGCDYKGYGFACKLPRLDLTAFVKEPMDQRIRPVLQLFCSGCHRSESWADNLLVQCDGCPMAYHQSCRRQQDLDDDFCRSSTPFFCSGDSCRDNLKKKRVVVEFSRKRLPLMRTPKQQQQQQQALMDAL
ncbi:hypothetical protein BC941DRAFT_223778 [Chlamydoabsidia padenii]|nr:hypothetical protein BC941DRAFT_223778 [Chlamydoabsidia padenii]